MTRQVINTFTDGINKDIDKSLLSNKSYIDAHNFRLITTKGNTTGILETVKGNALIDETTIAAGQFIIGSCEIRDKIILFTTSNITSNPTTEVNKKSMIYSFTINLETEVGSVATVLYDDSISASGKLYFSTYYPIKAISRYETPNIQKIYWTDGYNNIRYANIATYLTIDGTYDINLPISYMSVDKFEFLPKFEFTQPILKYMVGGKINTGMIAYAYQLYTANGAETAFSAVSAPIHIVSDNDSVSNTLNYKGNSEQINSGKGCIVEITNTNIGYNRLRLVRIEYENLNSVPKVIVCNEIEIPIMGSTVQVTDTGEILNELTIDEFNIASTELFKCEDVENKDSRLFAANITKSDFIVDEWDARAVRFKFGSTASVDDSILGSKTILANLSNWDDIATGYAEEHDGINTFNNPNNDGNAACQWMYQADGATLGAEGKNIKIDFETESIDLDVSDNATTFYATAPYENYASVWNGGKLSWQRDEIYRLAVVFGNDRGQVSDPKWICDLRMPSLHDVGYSELSYYHVLTGKTTTTRLYPRVWFKSFPTNATWAQIHRVKRERADRSVVTQGFCVPTQELNGSVYAPTYLDTVNLDTAGRELVKLVSPEINITKNISKQANDYLEYVTNYSSGKIKTTAAASFLDIYTHKCNTNTRVPYTGSTRTDINDAIPIVPSINQEKITIDNKVYLNYQWTDFKVAYGCSGLLVSYDNTAWSAESVAYVVANYKSNVYGSQYGGYTYEARQSNTYIPCSDVIKLSEVSAWIDINYGDTFINYFDISTCLADLVTVGARINPTSLYVPLESSINCDLRHDTNSSHITYDNTYSAIRQEYAGDHILAHDTAIIYNQAEDLYLYNTVYSQQIDIKPAISFSADKILETEFDCMIKASNVKSNGETSDSWSKFGINEFIEVDSKYGPVNALHNFNNRLYFFQDTGTGIVAVNERSLITDNNTSQLVLGTGGVLARYDYISNYVGCKDKFSVVSSIVGVYWFDRLSKSIYKHGEGLNNLSKSKYIQSYINTEFDSTFKALSHTDIHNDEILFTFYKVGDGFTIAFSEPVDAFISFYSFVPHMYIPYKHRFITTDTTLASLYLHDSEISKRGYLYGAYVDSTLEVLFNPEFLETKVFDNLFYISNTSSTTGDIFYDTFDHVKFYNDFQYTGDIPLTPGTNIKRRERTWTMAIPRSIVDHNISTNPDIFVDTLATQLFKERMRDKYLIAYFTYHNDGVYDRFSVSNIGLAYRNSIR